MDILLSIICSRKPANYKVILCGKIEIVCITDKFWKITLARRKNSKFVYKNYPTGALWRRFGIKICVCSKRAIYQWPQDLHSNFEKLPSNDEKIATKITLVEPCGDALGSKFVSGVRGPFARDSRIFSQILKNCPRTVKKYLYAKIALWRYFGIKICV